RINCCLVLLMPTECTPWALSAMVPDDSLTGDNTMRYQTHSDAQGRDGYGLVLNVKCHAFDFAEGGTDEQRQRAYNIAQESWWRKAKQAARKLGFDGVYSAGRMGGYIYPTFDGRAVTAADLDRSPYGYGRERARHLVSMLRKFRDYVRGAM